MVAMVYSKNWGNIDLFFREMPSLNISLNILEKNSAFLAQQHRSADCERLRKDLVFMVVRSDWSNSFMDMS